jgi:UV DNA damage endonuclease
LNADAAALGVAEDSFGLGDALQASNDAVAFAMTITVNKNAVYRPGEHRHGDSVVDHDEEMGEPMIRLGLCCSFRDQSIKFGTTTATALARMNRTDALAKLAALCLNNADALLAAFRFCAEHGIGCFRIISQILPLKTHPQQGYDVADLPDGDQIIRRFKECRSFAKKHGLRTCFHPDQFVVLNSQRPEIVQSSLKELEYQAEVAEWVGADVVNIHGGGAYGDKSKALDDFVRNMDRLSARARKRLTVENDDKLYTPADLLPVCRSTGIPLVYDVHHHRCNKDEWTIEEATEQAVATWKREPLFHISSPIDGWSGANPERHHDYIDVKDFPKCWRDLDVTVEVEAKAKELAVLKLSKDLQARSVRRS